MEDIILNMVQKLDNLAGCYITNPSTQNLIDFIHYRSDCLELTSKLLFGLLLNSHTAWMLDCYISVVTDELEIFDNGKSVTQPEFVEKIKKWRIDREWRKYKTEDRE